MCEHFFLKRWMRLSVLSIIALGMDISRNHLITTPKPLHRHPVLSPYHAIYPPPPAQQPTNYRRTAPIYSEANYHQSPAACQVLGDNSPSIPASTPYTFHFSPQKFANAQILLYLCPRFGKALPHHYIFYIAL